jgi:hypothetical protein
LSRSSTPVTAAELQAAYRLLGVAPGASPQEIRKRYLKLARRWHPDRFAGRRGLTFAEAKMKAINAAYHTIKNAPLGEGARVPPKWTVYRRAAAGTFRSWLRIVEREETQVPEGPWQRECPNCRKRIQVVGYRYVYCVHCGVGFFPDREGMSREGWLFPSAVAVYLVALVLQALSG